MADARDILHDIANGLGEMAIANPQGNWQQVGVDVAAPGQQQILQQQQQLQIIPQMQATLQQQQQILQQIQADLGVVRWTQTNRRIRFRNNRNPDNLQPLHKERTGGNEPMGALPLAQGPFPETFSQAMGLTANELDQLQDFYQVQFAGNLVQERRRAFFDYISFGSGYFQL